MGAGSVSERLEAPLREIVDHATDARGVVMLTLRCGHAATCIGRAPSGPDRKRCDRCDPVRRGAITSFIATGGDSGGCAAAPTITIGDALAAASPPLAASLGSSSQASTPLYAPAVAREAGNFSVDQAFTRRDAVPAVLSLSLSLSAPTVVQRAAKGGRR